MVLSSVRPFMFLLLGRSSFLTLHFFCRPSDLCLFVFFQRGDCSCCTSLLFQGLQSYYYVNNLLLLLSVGSCLPFLRVATLMESLKRLVIRFCQLERVALECTWDQPRYSTFGDLFHALRWPLSWSYVVSLWSQREILPRHPWFPMWRWSLRLFSSWF